jgi:hypothetical protein
MPALEGEEVVFGGGYTSLQDALVGANISTYAIATVVLCLRIYTSAFINRRTDLAIVSCSHCFHLCPPLT